MQQNTIPPPPVIQPLQVPSTVPSKIVATEVDKFRDSNIYSPTSNIFLTKAHIFAYSTLIRPLTEKTVRLLSRTLIDLEHLIGNYNAYGDKQPAEPFGYACQKAMKEQGITALLTANISNCIMSYLSDNGGDFPSIEAEKLYLMHQSCSQVRAQGDCAVALSWYYRFMDEELERFPQKNSVLFPMAFLEFGKACKYSLHEKYPQASAYANNMVQLMALNGISQPWIPLLGVIMTEKEFVVQLHLPSIVDGGFKLARVDVMQCGLCRVSLAQLVHVIVGWTDFCVAYLRSSSSDGMCNTIALPVRATNICFWGNKVYKSYDYRAISGKHIVAPDDRRDCMHYLTSGFVNGVEIVADFVNRDNNLDTLKIICYDKVMGSHSPCYVGHLVSLLSNLLALHRRGIAHGDIRFSNVIFSAATDEEVKATIIDFDFSGDSSKKVYPRGFNLLLDDGFRHSEVREGGFIQAHHDTAAAVWMCSQYCPEEISMPELLQQWAAAFDDKNDDLDLQSVVETLGRPEFSKVSLKLRKPDEAFTQLLAGKETGSPNRN